MVDLPGETTDLRIQVTVHRIDLRPDFVGATNRSQHKSLAIKLQKQNQNRKPIDVSIWENTKREWPKKEATILMKYAETTRAGENRQQRSLWSIGNSATVERTASVENSRHRRKTLKQLSDFA